MTLAYLPTVRAYGQPWLLAATLPLAGVLYAGMTLDSAFRGRRAPEGEIRGKRPGGGPMAMETTQPKSGTKDKNYDLVTVLQLCLEHVWRLDQYASDAEQEGDDELASLFRRMQEHSRKGGEECKRLLRERLGREET
jgi:hypothetical protein